MNETNAETVEKNIDTPKQNKFLQTLKAIFPSPLSVVLGILIFLLIPFYEVDETSFYYLAQIDTMAKILLFLFAINLLFFSAFIGRYTRNTLTVFTFIVVLCSDFNIDGLVESLVGFALPILAICTFINATFAITKKNFYAMLGTIFNGFILTILAIVLVFDDVTWMMFYLPFCALLFVFAFYKFLKTWHDKSNIWQHQIIRICAILGLSLAVFILGSIASTELIPMCQTVKGKTFLVLGTGKYLKSGKINRYYQTRIDTAAKAYKEGLAKDFILSGDNSREDYNEPQTMKDDLVALGVPENIIKLDYAGLRTLDSIRRCKNVFGVNDPVLITQYLHAKRAVYLARKTDMPQVYAYYAPMRVPLLYLLRNNSREYLAWIKAWIDINITNKKAKFEK